MDIDNDGEIGDADSGLAQKAFASGATQADIDKGTEFLFANDQLSNGLWDGDDSDPDKPAAEKDDDDAQQIKIDPGITEGEVWLEHPAVAGLSFYESRECNASEKINLSPSSKFTVSDQNPFPEEIFVRADGSINFPQADPQVEGDLILKVKVGTKEIEVAKIKLTIVEMLGAKKYFHAATDYVYESNSKFHARDWQNGSNTYRIISMLESKTTMGFFDSFPTRTRAMAGVMAANAQADVIVNGNQCFDVDFNWLPPHRMTERCHGRVVVGGAVVVPPSDDRVAAPGSPLAGPDGAYISQTGGTFTMSGGVAPAAGLDTAMGGLSTNYATRAATRSQMIGIVDDVFDDQIVFTATQIAGAGGVPDLRDAAVVSGVKNSLAGASAATAARSTEFLALDGAASVGFAYEKPSLGLQAGPNLGSRPRSGIPEYVNTYLTFECQNPRQP